MFRTTTTSVRKTQNNLSEIKTFDNLKNHKNE